MMADMYAWYLENLDSKKSRKSLQSIGKKMLSSVVDRNSVALHSSSYVDNFLLEVEEAGSLFRHFYGSGNESFKSDLGWDMLTWGVDVGMLISPWSLPKMRSAAFARVLHTIDEKS